MCCMIRTFHPVGQGLFCSEQFYTHDDHRINIVYDCGSKSPGHKHVEGIIMRTFEKGESIDALYISHFDSDHICGVPFLLSYCNIKRIYVPFLEDKTEALFWKLNYINDSYCHISRNVEEQPDAIFKLLDFACQEGESEIRNEGKEPIAVIPVRPINENQFDYIWNHANIEDSNENTPVKSPYEFSINVQPDGCCSWRYLPFTLIRCRRKKYFEAILDAELKKLDPNLTLQYFCNNPLKCIKLAGNVTKQKKWFTKVKNLLENEFKNNNAGNVNSNSLVLYSGCDRQVDRFCRSAVYYGRSSKDPYNQPKASDHCIVKTINGCLYCGDYDAKSPIGWKGLCSFYAYHKCVEYIGCVVLPHHGSEDNFNDNFKNMPACVFIASYGTKNSHGHPSAGKISELRENEKVVFTVNEYSGCVCNTLKHPLCYVCN